MRRSRCNGLLEKTNLGKRFGGIRALPVVNSELQAGEIHGILGENGAGKSTLMNLVGCSITGQGIITLDETPIRFTGPQHAETSGIETIFQVLDLLPTLGVAANHFLGREIVKPGGFRRGDESTSTAPFQRG